MSSIPLITVVANYFGNKNSATELKFSTLYNIKNAVESHFLKTENAFVYVNISWDEISYIIENYPKYFRYNENYTSIVFKPSDEFYEDLFFIFNTTHNLDESTSRNNIIEFLKKYIENDLVE